MPSGCAGSDKTRVSPGAAGAVQREARPLPRDCTFPWAASVARARWALRWLVASACASAELDQAGELQQPLDLVQPQRPLAAVRNQACRGPVERAKRRIDFRDQRGDACLVCCRLCTDERRAGGLRLDAPQSDVRGDQFVHGTQRRRLGGGIECVQRLLGLVETTRQHQAADRDLARMGWEAIPWYTITDSFDKDFGVDEWHGHNAFIRDGEQVFRTYFINGRGDEAMGTLWSYLDMTALGRQELWEDSPQGYPQDRPYKWWNWHDRYVPGASVDPAWDAVSEAGEAVFRDKQRDERHGKR